MASQPDANEIVLKFPEWQVNSFDVDYSGRLAVLSVQKWLAVISLDHPSGSEFGSGELKVKAKRKLGTHNKYESKGVYWNHSSDKHNLLASTNHQKIDVWDATEGKAPVMSIKAHTRPVSDLSWAPSDPNLIASCAVDSYVHIWDIRDSKRPQVSFKTLGGLNSGASLVQWNKSNGNVLASAHDSDVRIWDMKKPATVSACISAHMNKIHDIDWCFRTEKHLTTCSHDATVKFWDVQSSHREPQSTIKAGSHPIWRARNYPFGRGVAIVLVPAVHSGDRRVFIYSRTNLSSPVAVLDQHTEAVTDLQWRRYGGECQLMSLSKDKTLRIWSLSNQLQQDLETDQMVDTSYVYIKPTNHAPQTPPTVKAGIEAETSFGKPTKVPPHVMHSNSSPSLLTSTPSLKSNMGVSVGVATPSLTSNNSSFFSPSPNDTLAHEFSLLTDIPNLEMELVEPSQRRCQIKIEQASHIVRMGISFPSHYPNGAAPSFTPDPSTTIDITCQQELVKVVTEAAYANVRMHRPCLEICLRKLAKTFESFMSRPDPPPHRVQQDFDIRFGKLDDDRIPFPRTSGARFCSNGILVCFSCPMLLGLDTAKTPKSLDMLNTSHKMRTRPRQSSLHGSLPKRTGSGPNLQSLGQSYLQLPSKSSPKSSPKEGHNIRERTSRRTGDSFSQYYSATIYDVGSFLSFDYKLAKAYSLAGNSVEEICTRNATVASSHNRPDLVQAWTAVYLITSQSFTIPKELDEDIPWPMHPFGRQLLQSLFSHYANLHDVQTLAMLACICQLQCQHVHEYFKTLHNPTQQDPQPSTGVALTERKHIHNSTDSFADWDMGYQDNLSIGQEAEDTNHDEMLQHQMNCMLLDETMNIRCNEYRRSYADILYHWGLLTQRSEVMKHQFCSSQPMNKENVLVGQWQCMSCHLQLKKPFCSRCRTFALTCVVCNVAVKGCSNLCLGCGHGGHTHHLMEWFSCHNRCASGCGCQCLEASGWT